MGILNNALGINLTNEEPLTFSPYSSSMEEGGGVPPPPLERMITEGGIPMITESTLEFMITE